MTDNWQRIKGRNPFDMTPRELQVVKLSVNGYVIGEIAELLSISKTTVKSHRETAYRKLGVRNVAELTRRWIYEVELKDALREVA